MLKKKATLLFCVANLLRSTRKRVGWVSGAPKKKYIKIADPHNNFTGACLHQETELRLCRYLLTRAGISHRIQFTLVRVQTQASSGIFEKGLTEGQGVFEYRRHEQTRGVTHPKIFARFTAIWGGRLLGQIFYYCSKGLKNEITLIGLF